MLEKIPEKTKFPTIEFEVYGEYALFSDPITRVGGEKCTYQIPTYEALKGVAMSIYWKPTFTWFVDAVRVMNPIRTERKGIRGRLYDDPDPQLYYYMYLKSVKYQVRAHIEWNLHHPEFANDRNSGKHISIANRYLEKGGRRDIFLGTRECQCYVAPCVFGKGDGAYDDVPAYDFGFMLHGLTYADEAWNKETEGRMTSNFWFPTMRYGIVAFPRPEECPRHRNLGKMDVKTFSARHEVVEE
ncbi:MAG: type I-C CRISPR-associated protein Cas5 [Anaerolineaceae bacterium]|nr:type I-C CRISPR-associated protein Cas5 [Anaerolineaceae bacterium]